MVVHSELGVDILFHKGSVKGGKTRSTEAPFLSI